MGAFRQGHTAGYNAAIPNPPEIDREEWINGYREGWALAVKFGAIVSPVNPPL